MVTIVKNPTGHKIIDQAITADITNSSGDALVTFPYHGLGTGDYVYITSDLDEYNGFWYVTAIDTNSFKLSEYSGAGFVQYFQDTEIDYFLTNDHIWNSVFLPIVYKATNDRWPINTVDTARTVSSFADDMGYTDLTLSGVLKASFLDLDYVKISGAANDNLNGVWQIVEKISTSRIVIDLPYNSANSFSGATVQFYYNNYQVKVKIYAGLEGSHPWASKKPFTEVAELSLTPDNNGQVMFSVSDYIQGRVAIKNNPTLFSMPLNLDAFTGFYIATAEAYDTTDGYSYYTHQTDFVTDSFVGYAVAGKLPFKNVYSGDYSDYVYTEGSPAKWLTMLERLLAVEDKYFDISFIKNTTGTFDLLIKKYIANYLASEERVTFADQGIGVYRVPITPDGDYDSFCVQVKPPLDASPISLPALTGWATRSISGTLVDWTTGANPSVELEGGPLSGQTSEMLWVAYPFVEGNTYTITAVVNVNNNSLAPVTISIRDDSFVLQFSQAVFPLPSGNNNISITFTANANSTRIALVASVAANITRTFALQETTGTVIEADASLTEEICIDIIESCDAASGFTPTDIRLLEDGSYRLLE